MSHFAQRLQALSSAEDFLHFFGVPYEEHVVRVNRLHILKRFHQYLNQAENLSDGSGDNLPDADEVQTFRRYRELLARAYTDFVHSNAATEKVFKVFQEADGVKAVPVDRLREALAERRRAATG